MRNFFLYHSAKGSDGSPHFPDLSGQGGKPPSSALQAHETVLWRLSFISAEATEQNYQLSVLQVLLPYRCTLSKAKLKRISLRITKDISVFSLTNLKVLQNDPCTLVEQPQFSWPTKWLKHCLQKSQPKAENNHGKVSAQPINVWQSHNQLKIQACN